MQLEPSAEQVSVIESSASVKQIIAAAGSGKTRTVIDIANGILGEASGDNHALVRKKNVIAKNEREETESPTYPLLLLTFSRKACQEMHDRLDGNAGKAQIHTFHGFCYQTIRKHYPDGQKLQVVEDETKLRILRPLFYRFRYEIGGIPFSMLLSNPERFREEFPRAAFRIFRFWEQYKSKHGLLEYSDLIRLVLTGLKAANQKLSWAREIPGSFETIIVDEFQDTDPHQLEFLKRMRPERLVVVGDDWQGIYSFRGADIEPFLKFKRHFPAVQRHFLSVNFRSVPGIVKAGNRLIKASSGQIKKKVRPHRSEVKDSVLALTLDGNPEEVIVEMMQQCSLDWTILCRSNYRKDRWLEAGLSEERCITIHRSKGLEFEMVILDILGGWSGATNEQARDEEVRIAYVALTRARDLFLALYKKDYGSRTGDAWIWNTLFEPVCKKINSEKLERRIRLK
ncbi:MAG: hypothetical protein CMF59_16170 [Leptospiraceae bacterium]|nr:hypothetical protein [Leptospiraceae bacterium]